MKRLLILFIALIVAPRLDASDKNIYLDLMQKAVEAYTPQQIEDYISAVDEGGIREHGYARLTSNIGILIAHGRLQEMKPLFVRMMDVCMRQLPVAHLLRKGYSPGNDFAVKEIVCCILELEKAGTFPAEKTAEWRSCLSPCSAVSLYDSQPEPGSNKAHNWCVFGAASECARVMAGMGGEIEYAEKYISDQLRFFDVNGMYKDPNQPMVYDIVTRLQFMAALDFGYNGPSRAALEDNLLKSAFHTIEMQSVTGEIPYGGRSNQFLHNETSIAAVFEYYASWMKRRGDLKSAARFKAAAMRAIESLDFWLEQTPVTHIKNRYPTESGYGCERYAYFNKYMVTMGSWAYLAYRFADDSIEPSRKEEPASTFVMSPEFHRIVMNKGGYTLEFDVNADKHYDCSGLGRFQRKGAPCTVAFSTPCTTKPNYRLDLVNEGPLSLSPGWEKYEILSSKPGKLVLTNGTDSWETRLSSRGLRMKFTSEEAITVTVPVFMTDGETETAITVTDKAVSVSYKGWTCRWTVKGGRFVNTGKVYGNRNGHMLRVDAVGGTEIEIRASIASAAAPVTASGPSPLALSRRESLENCRKSLKRKSSPSRPAYEYLLRKADKYLDAVEYSVTMQTVTPPSGDKRDYMSMGPYWWPDPNKKDGLPYIRKDGRINPESKQLEAGTYLKKTCSALQALGYAYYYSGDEKYAAKAARIIRTFFTDPKTGMNPHLTYGQCIPGRCTGRGIGLIDTKNLANTVDAITLLEGSSSWTETDKRELQEWFSSFLTWMLESDIGKEEGIQKNNHGTAYDLQVCCYSIYCGKPEIALAQLEKVSRSRMDVQFPADASQPLELARTKSWNYTTMNLSIWMDLTRVAGNLGVDMWEWKNSLGVGLKEVVEWFFPYIIDHKEWPYENIAGTLSPSAIAYVAQTYCQRYPEANLQAILKGIEEYTSAGKSLNFNTLPLRLQYPD